MSPTFPVDALNPWKPMVAGTLILLSLAAIACGADNEARTNPSATSALLVNPITAKEPAAQTVQSNAPSDSPTTTGNNFVNGNGSEATFTVREKLPRLPAPNDAVLRTDDISGTIDLDAGTVELELNLHALTSDQSRRDRYVRDRLFRSRPVATISFETLGDIGDAFFTGEQFDTRLDATVNVKGSDAIITFDLETRLDGDTLFILGRADFVWADFGMTAPRSSLFDVEDDVHVEILLASTRTQQGSPRGNLQLPRRTST